MGYMDLSISGSDMAADAAYSLIEAMVTSLKISLKDPGNNYNTSGAVNVAMIFDEMIIPSEYFAKSYNENLTNARHEHKSRT